MQTPDQTLLVNLLSYPFDALRILRKKKAIKRALLDRGAFMERRVAILGGSTTSEIKDILELFLLNAGIRPAFYESGYNRYYEDVSFDNPALDDFKPDIVYVHTTQLNIDNAPEFQDSADKIQHKLECELGKFRQLWEAIHHKYQCAIIQNNFELPGVRPLGNQECSDVHGRISFISRLNLEFAQYTRLNKNFYLNDIHYLAASVGLARWHDKRLWHAYKYAVSHEAIPLLAHNVAGIVNAIYGKQKKCLVVDLDNTLWGGIIGDDGVEGIHIGKETVVAEGYTEFQAYLKQLQQRGVLLAVCSKNEDKHARQGLQHPDSVLRPDDFVTIKANWLPKPRNIVEIAEEINLLPDSFVFVDDNPAERDLVARQLPEVAVPDLGADVTDYVVALDRSGFFEPATFSEDDQHRNRYYRENFQRELLEKSVQSYDDFLQSLAMEAQISPFLPVYLDRIAQLTNKTNQFNLTNKRLTYGEVEKIAGDPSCLTLYGRLKDKFGDNGLVSVIIGAQIDDILHIELWLMSCRVFQRGLENAMFDEVIRHSLQRGVKAIRGTYRPTGKNVIVEKHYEELGFELVNRHPDGESEWIFPVSSDYKHRNTFIKVSRDD